MRTTMKFTELKPCPFCGGTARYDVDLRAVRCDDNLCGGQGPVGGGGAEAAQAWAYKTWNRRSRQRRRNRRKVPKVKTGPSMIRVGSAADFQASVEGRGASIDIDPRTQASGEGGDHG